MRPQAEATPAVSAAEMDTLIRTALAQRDEAALERLAAEMVRQHKYPEANRLAAAAVEVRALHYGVQSREYARGLAMQGGLLRRQGKWEQAEEAYQKVLALQEAAGGADASTLEFMALTARRRKDYEKAVAMYQRALALQPDARLTARLYAGLGSLEADLGRPVEAEQHFRAALQARDDGSSDSASTLELLVRLLNSRDRSGEAKPLAERAARIRQEAVAMANRPVPGGQSAVKVEEGMEAPKLVSKIEPQYSEEARAARHWGTVVLAIVIGPDGRVYSVELKESLGLGLDEQAADAVRQWVFSPGKANGTPVAVKATVEVNFRLM